MMENKPNGIRRRTLRDGLSDKSIAVDIVEVAAFGVVKEYRFASNVLERSHRRINSSGYRF